MNYIDIAYSPINNVNNEQRIINPIKSIFGKRIIKLDNNNNNNNNNNNKIIRKQFKK